MDFASELKKSMELEGNGDSNCYKCARYSHQRIGKGTGTLGNERERERKIMTSGDHPNYSIIKISRNTEESPVDLRRLAAIQTPVRNNQQ